MTGLNAVEVTLEECAEGDITAAGVLDGAGNQIVAAQTVVNPYILERMRGGGVRSLLVYDPPVRQRGRNYTVRRLLGNYRESVILAKDMIHKLASGRKFDYTYVADISDIIYSHVEESNVLQCIQDIRSNDTYTYSHMVNTAFYSMLIAKWLGLGEREIKKALQSGFLHDIGKSRIPGAILNKRGPLTDSEFHVIQKHPVYGYFILQDSRYLEFDIKRAVLLHHERVNRSGYPFNIANDGIGLFARIVSVADVYDAITTDRVYKNRQSPFSAFRMFLGEGHDQFDRLICQAFVSKMTANFIGSEVSLSNGQQGTIVYISPADLLSAVVQVGSSYYNVTRSGSVQITDVL